MIEVIDAIDRRVRLLGTPERVVSLVPSETVSVADLVGVELVDGKDLFWYGTRVAVAIERQSDRVERLRSLCFGVQPNN